LNTSFLQSQDDFERAGDEGYTVWKPEFKNGLKASQQNFKSPKPISTTRMFGYSKSPALTEGSVFMFSIRFKSYSSC
jgi:hypothetical protein